MIFIFAIVLIVVVGVSIWIFRAPVRGLYLAIFGSGFLLSPYLPLVRRKLSIVEPIILITWLAMLCWYVLGKSFSKGAIHNIQKKAIYWPTALVICAVVSYIFPKIRSKKIWNNQKPFFGISIRFLGG
jgi:hypothetical protein